RLRREEGVAEVKSGVVVLRDESGREVGRCDCSKKIVEGEYANSIYVLYFDFPTRTLNRFVHVVTEDSPLVLGFETHAATLDPGLAKMRGWAILAANATNITSRDLAGWTMSFNLSTLPWVTMRRLNLRGVLGLSVCRPYCRRLLSRSKICL